MIYVDADDFAETNHDLDVLRWIKDRNPCFRLTLFVIPAACSLPWLRSMMEVEWFRLVPHGWAHKTSRECQDWSFDTSRRYLDAMEALGLHHGFKAPGWQVSDGMFAALEERGWWIADQKYNDARRPEGLRVFYPGAHHYHVGKWGEGKNANVIRLSAAMLAGLKGEDFGFLGD